MVDAVYGFAFNFRAGEEASTLGRLAIPQARMNPDLTMGDDLLKKHGQSRREGHQSLRRRK